jgi:branched-chain amino acid transport system substrate-binding protein
MSRFKLVIVLLVLALVSMLAVACAPEEPPPAEEPEVEEVEEPEVEEVEEPEVEEVEEPEVEAELEPVRIAVAVVTSGAGVDVLGLDSLRGAEIAQSERPEVLGFPVELVPEDTLCSAEGGQTVANRLAADPTIVAVIGHSCSSSCRPAAAIYEQAGLTMISPSCTAPSLTSDEEHVAAFLRVCFNDTYQGPVAAQFAYDVLGVRSVATIHDGSPYAEQLATIFGETIVDLGGELVASEAINVGDTDMRPVLTTISTNPPDMVYAPIFPAEAGLIVNQMQEVPGMEDAAFMGADGLWASSFVEAAGEAGEGAYVSGPDLTGQAYQVFRQTYIDTYGEPPVAAFHAHAYDAYNMILNGIEQVGVPSEDGTSLVIDRATLRETLFATTDFVGLTGVLTCTELGDCGAEYVAAAQIQDGIFVPALREE